MDRFEEAVMEYITADPNCLFKSQMHLPYNKENGVGGSLPDFVALNFKDKCIYIVEVTTAADAKGIIQKISERDKCWYKAIQEYDAEWVTLTKNWNYRVCLFVRDQLVNKVTSRLESCEDVSVKSLNEIMNPWEWNWVQVDRPKNTLHNN